jgi:hypothetical protein
VLTRCWHRKTLNERFQGAFTEHVGKTSPYFGEFAAEVRAVREGARLPVFVGIEINSSYSRDMDSSH